MVTNYVNTKALLEASITEKLFEKLVSQLAKDFTLSNISIELPFEISPTNLKTILHQKIYNLILEDFSEYLNLLYIIDVPEHAIKKIKATEPLEISDQVSFLILKREFQKVLFKEQYG
ncbi:hypothetical protein KO500_02170 [Cellulophaga baltica]|uniref:hypothetical protein n=1 Tax=Cellulophaga TaxID=104264 RepID=UPI001C07EBE9|nr:MULTISPECIES: hypothetical protein [Cellulophaga]MBU2995216.1 hypothetical protein [Cellulophaga baltica]MDO6766611.1 hypothetical protein [Cellulophaga sp. 1_MG-2023]